MCNEQCVHARLTCTCTCTCTCAWTCSVPVRPWVAEAAHPNPAPGGAPSVCASRLRRQGELASVAADFGVMPSLFEPCGLVREEFFAAGAAPTRCDDQSAARARFVRRLRRSAGKSLSRRTASGVRARRTAHGAPHSTYAPCAGTPLVASNTGGLADHVKPYCEADGTGAGLVFDGHAHTALLTQLERALALYADLRHYAALRQNAHAAACDVGQTAAFWEAELQRLRACRAAHQLDLDLELHAEEHAM
eukprot:7389588-Prymnesium_polylepis.2